MVIKRHDIRKINEKLVLQEIINNGPISRSQISRNLHLNKVSVSSILSDFNKNDITIEIGEGKSTSSGGRRPTLLTLNKRYGYFITIDLGPSEIKVMSIYLDGTIQRFTEIKNRDEDINKILPNLYQYIESHQISNTSHGLLGIGIAFYGIVYQDKINYSAFLNLNNIDLAKEIREKYHVPVHIINEANSNALYQKDYGYDNEHDDIACISIHQGIGAGLILNNQLYLGYQGEAGEIGNMIIRSNSSSSPQRVETICSEVVVLNNLREKLDTPDLSLHDIEQRYLQGDTKVKKELTSFVQNMSDIINNVIVTYAPQKIYFVSEMMELIPSLLIKIKKRIQYLNDYPIPLELINNSRYSTLLGCYSFLLREFFDLQTSSLHLSLKNK